MNKTWQELKMQILLQYESDMLELQREKIEYQKGWTGLDFTKPPSFYTWFCNSTYTEKYEQFLKEDSTK